MQRPFIESSCLFTNSDCLRLLDNLHINPTEILDAQQERAICPKCKKSRKYFCYTCYILVDEVKDKVPKVKLPVKIDIIKHQGEVDGKCTSTHAAVLAPGEVKIYLFPEIPDYTAQNVVLAFPSKTAVSLPEYCKNMERSTCNNVKAQDADVGPSDYSNIISEKKLARQFGESSCHSGAPFDKVIFIDSTWRQTKQICGDKRLNGLPCISLSSHKSLFWRHQRNKPMTYLATIEAIYYFLVDLEEVLHPDQPYQGQYDNMLFFFKFFYQKIRKVYDQRVVNEIHGNVS